MSKLQVEDKRVSSAPMELRTMSGYETFLLLDMKGIEIENCGPYVVLKDSSYLRRPDHLHAHILVFDFVKGTIHLRSPETLVRRVRCQLNVYAEKS